MEEAMRAQARRSTQPSPLRSAFCAFFPPLSSLQRVARRVFRGDFQSVDTMHAIAVFPPRGKEAKCSSAAKRTFTNWEHFSMWKRKLEISRYLQLRCAITMQDFKKSSH